MLNSHTRSLSNAALLARLLGNDRAEAVADRALVDLFALRPQPPSVKDSAIGDPVVSVFHAARELLGRALAEELRLGDALDSPQRVRDLLRLRLAGLPHEVFVVLLLDSQHRLIDLVDLFRGTLTQTSVYPREVVRLALLHNAAAVIFAHNHPSGALDPSQADIQLTNTLRQALALVDVRTVDHFVVAGTRPPLSFAERGLL